jgi:hypothetical protein
VNDDRMPRWFWFLPAIAMVAWWPVAPWWQSDDYVAVHYAQSWERALADFTGPQYGATDLWAFWRPLITASFRLDQALGGPFPPLSHVSNVLAHAVSTLLVACVWRRFLAPQPAFLAGLLWALMPTHQGSICWAVGRVDSHTTVWCLAAVLVALRGADRREAATPALFALTAGALLSKESALVVPALATLAAAARSATPGLVGRLRDGANWALGAWIALAVYLPLRWWALGRFGGYDAATFDLPAMARGLMTVLGQLAAPLRWIGVPDDLPLPEQAWTTAAALPVAVAVVLAAARRPRIAVGAFAVYLVAVAPAASFLAAADNPQTLRLQYLPSVALVGVVAAAGRWPVVAALIAFAWPFVAMRNEQIDADRESGAMHRALLREAADGAPDPMFVAGLPHASGRGGAVQLHFGVDRMLQPPFTAQARRLFAFRPLAVSDSAFRLELVDGVPAALPSGSTWAFHGASSLVQTLPRIDLPDLTVAGIDENGVDLTRPALDAMLPADGPRPVLTTPGVRAQAHRLTVFTAGGYLATICRDHAPEGTKDGALDFRAWFAGDGRSEPARYGFGGAEFVGEALGVPTTMDLESAFPCLLEAGSIAPDGAFQATHRARRMIVLRFDRGFAGWVRKAQGR